MRVDVRRQVLDAAIDICASDGPDAISMREVARRSEVSHQAPYHHFGDRAGIFAAIAEEGFGKLADSMNAALESGGSPARSCLEVYLRMARDHLGHFRVMFRSDICGVSTHVRTQGEADRAYGSLEKMVELTLGRPADDREVTTWASMMWSLAHGFVALLVDGPLAAKLPSDIDVDEHVADFVGLATEMVENQAKLSLLKS